MNRQTFAEVVVELKSRQVDRSFHYQVPEQLKPLLQPGHRVLVPFGPRKVTGFVVVTDACPDPDLKDIKAILDLMDEEPLLNQDQIDLARWLAGYYACPLIHALLAVAGPGLQVRGARKVRGYWPEPAHRDWVEVIKELANKAPKRSRVLNAAVVTPGLSRRDLAAAGGATPAVVDALVKAGYLTARTWEERRNPYSRTGLVNELPLLTEEQGSSEKEVCQALDEGRQEVFLLHGVTGSGKTEVYLRCVARALVLGRQALVLVPEISLTAQMVNWFKGRFGERVAVLHSRLSPGEKYDEWKRIQSGQAPVVLGARSAVFAPLANLGLLIIDEEHEFSYKQEESPRYHARAVALYLVRRHRAILILGSATPSLESGSRVLSGGPYRCLSMKHRIDRRSMPAVHVVDMRQESRLGNRGPFSALLLQKMEHCLSSGWQVLLFLNRRGFNTLVVCRECGMVLKCPHCDISLTYHSNSRVLCHYCRYSVMAPGMCPSCRSLHLGYLGMGTQKIEQQVQEFFPSARVLRMDADTTTRKGSHEIILQAFKDGGADILIGTQMVAKGLDLKRVTLVGVVAADLALHMPDFRAAERTFQILTQVAGRSGRGQHPGEVVVQTYCPGHYAVQAAAGHDYVSFFRREMEVRRELYYPPFSRMARFIVAGPGEEDVEAGSLVIREVLAELSGVSSGEKPVSIIGPAPAPLSRVRGKYRWHLVLWGRGPEVHRLIRNAVTVLETRWRSKKANWTVDIDPQSMM